VNLDFARITAILSAAGSLTAIIALYLRKYEIKKLVVEVKTLREQKDLELQKLQLEIERLKREAALASELAAKRIYIPTPEEIDRVLKSSSEPFWRRKYHACGPMGYHPFLLPLAGILLALYFIGRRESVEGIVIGGIIFILAVWQLIDETNDDIDNVWRLRAQLKDLPLSVIALFAGPIL
jgi:hypothetical protein